MKRMAVISAGFVPVPAVDGGAGEELTTEIIKGNEKKGDYFMDIYTIESPKLCNIKYKNAEVIQLHISKLNWFFCKARNAFLKLFNRRYRFIPYNRVLLKKFRDNYDLILIENNIDDQKYEDAKNQVEHFYDLLDEKTNIMTNNYIFDTLLNDYIFLIKSQFDTKVKLLINIGNDSFFKDFNNCDKIINTISNFFEQSDKTYLEIKLIEHEAYVQLDLFVENKENNIDKINQDMNVEYFEDYAHLKVIFDK